MKEQHEQHHQQHPHAPLGSGSAHVHEANESDEPDDEDWLYENEPGQPNENRVRVNLGPDMGIAMRECSRPAFALLCIIAQYANLREGRHPYSLALGEALLRPHDFDITGHEFFGARRSLERRGYASFRQTKWGWVGKLSNRRIFQVFPDDHYDDEFTTQGD